MIPFRDRHDAGKQLAEVLAGRRLHEPVVLAIPRGGVPVGSEIASRLGCELGVVVARKLGAPGMPELAIGAVTADGTAFINDEVAGEVGATERYIDQVTQREREEAARREVLFDGHLRPEVRDRDVIVVDDGLATGATAIAAVRSMRNAGARRVILAIPVAPPASVRRLEHEADEVVCPHVVEDFWAVGQFYIDFRPTVDAEVRQLLDGQRRDAVADPATSALHVVRGNVTLAAALTVPPGKGPFPCVVFVHGLGSGKDSPRNMVISARLVDAGIATALFDLSGHGESSPDPRGHAAYIDDLLAVVDRLREEPSIDVRRLGISGSSYGGVVAVEAVHSHAVNPAAMVLRAPPIDAGDLDAIHVPTLCVVGQEDGLLDAIRRAVTRSNAATLAVVPGASHLFDEPGTLDIAVTLTVDWFTRYLFGVPNR